MKKIIKCAALLLAVILTLSFAACSQPAPAQTQPPATQAPGAPAPAPGGETPAGGDEVYTLTFAVSWVKGNVNWPRAEYFAEEVERVTNGRLKIDIIGGADVFPATETVEAVMSGVVDGCYTSTGYSATYIPEVDALAISDMTVKEMIDSGAVDTIQSYLDPNGLVYIMGLNEVEYTPFMIYTIDPIEKLDDLKGLKIRTSPGFWNELAVGLGATPVPLGLGDTFSALEQGMVQAITAPSFIGSGEGFFEYIKYQIRPGVLRPGAMFVFNKEAWEGIPEDIRKTVMDNRAEIARVIDEKYEKVVSGDNYAKLEEAGGTNIELSADDAAKLKQIAEDAAWGAIAAKVPQETIDKLKQAVMK